MSFPNGGTERCLIVTVLDNLRQFEDKHPYHSYEKYFCGERSGVVEAMKPSRPTKSQALQPTNPVFDGLLRELREFITESRRQVLRAVDVVHVRTCWGVGQHIVEFEQGGSARAEYGAKLLPRLAERLTEEFGRGFDASNLRYMRLFYLAFPICDALRHELSWTHYKLVLPTEEQLRLELIREQRLLEELAHQTKQPKCRITKQK